MTRNKSQNRPHGHPGWQSLQKSLLAALIGLAATPPVLAAPEPLPAWLDESRVTAHLRFGQNRRSTLEAARYTEFAAKVREMGARMATVGVKTADENPWWTTPRPEGGKALGTAEQLIDAFHDQGIRFIAYFWISTDARIAEEHPDWICRDWKGEPSRARVKGVRLDITGPYREVVLQRMLQVAALGVDGFYFDERHLPEPGCWGGTLEAEFRRQHGGKAPSAPGKSALYAQWLDFKAQRVTQTFGYWRDELQRKYPGKAFIVSATTLPALSSREFRTELPAVALTKTEYNNPIRAFGIRGVFDTVTALPALSDPRAVARWARDTAAGVGGLPEPPRDVRLALGWNMLRDAGGGRPPITWSLGLPDAAHTQSYVAALVGHGSIAELDIGESLLVGGKPPEAFTPRDGLVAGFQLGERLSGALAGTRPLRWAAVHLAEAARDRRWPDLRLAWREVLWPVNGLYQYFLRRQLPVGVLTDQQLSQAALDGYRVIALPNSAELGAAQRSALREFESRGGRVVSSEPDWVWAHPTGAASAMKSIDGALASVRSTVPAEVLGAPPLLHAVTHVATSGRRHVVALINDFSWVRLVVDDDATRPPPPAAAVSGLRLRLSSSGLGWSGRPKVREAVTGQELQVEPVDGGYLVKVPTFRHVAAVVIEPA